MLFFLSALGVAAFLGLVIAMVWGGRRVLRNAAVIRLERRLNPVDVLELNRAFARVQWDVLHDD